MQIDINSVDVMARHLYENAIKNTGNETCQWVFLSLTAKAYLRAAAMIEKEIKAMKNKMEKDNA